MCNQNQKWASFTHSFTPGMNNQTLKKATVFGKSATKRHERGGKGKEKEGGGKGKEHVVARLSGKRACVYILWLAHLTCAAAAAEPSCSWEAAPACGDLDCQQ